MKVVFPVEYCPRSVTIGFASKSLSVCKRHTVRKALLHLEGHGIVLEEYYQLR
jgi:hypothetical protein